ncbi:MAG: Tetratricopeptide repeat-containing protein [Chlorobi bacterium]|nr:Tetratricopeptide repeat-containing protein [Chlorobiota bacterium]
MAKRQVNLDTRTPVPVSKEGQGFFLGNLRLLGIIGIVLLVGIIAIVLVNISSGKSNDRAQLELARIRPYYDRGDFSVAVNGDPSKKISGEKIRGLKDLVADWKSTPAGKIAALYLGNSYLALGQAKQASEPYEVAAGASDELLSSAGHAGLAAVSESAGSYDAAAKEYAKAASIDHLELNTPQYLLSAARNYEMAKNKDEAVKNYRTVATQYAQSAANAQARLALARLNVEL